MATDTKKLTIRNMNSADAWDHENAFYWFSHPTRMHKMLAHYELYQSILDLPGDIFELGVYKGASLVRFASFRDLLENQHSRKIVGFDAFGEFPTEQVQLEADKHFIERFEQAGGDGLSEDEINAIMAHKGYHNVDLVKGNVFDTLDTYLTKHPASRIALLHLDMDVKEPTAYALDKLYDKVVPNGLIIFDDYHSVAGATEAADEFLAKHRLEIHKTSHYHVPAFIRKPV